MPQAQRHSQEIKCQDTKEHDKGVLKVKPRTNRRPRVKYRRLIYQEKPKEKSTVLAKLERSGETGTVVLETGGCNISSVVKFSMKKISVKSVMSN